jgi:hypothetical protein
VFAGDEAFWPLCGVRELLRRACVRDNVLNNKTN